MDYRYTVSLRKRDKSFLDIAEFDTSDEALAFIDALEVPVYMMFKVPSRKESLSNESKE